MPFDFEDVVRSPGGAMEQDSNRVIPREYNQPAPVSVSNGSYSISNGPFTTANGTINPGQSIALRVFSNGEAGNVATVTVNIGGTTADFNVVTIQNGGDPPPDNGNQ